MGLADKGDHSAAIDWARRRQKVAEHLRHRELYRRHQTVPGRNTTAAQEVSLPLQELFMLYQEAADAARIVDDQRHLKDAQMSDVQRAISEAEEELRLLDLQMSSTNMEEASLQPRRPDDRESSPSNHGMCDSMHTPLGTAYQVCGSMRSTIPRGASRRHRNRQSTDPTTQSRRAWTRRSEWRDPLDRRDRLGPPSTPTVWVEILNELSADGFVATSDLTPETVTKLKMITKPSYSDRVAPRSLF